MTIGARADLQGNAASPNNGDSFPPQIPLTKKGQPRKRAPGAGRPLHTLTPEEQLKVDQLATVGSSFDDIAIELGKTKNCIRENPNYRAAVEKGHAKLKNITRKALFKLILDGNVAAVIFASKALCGLSDRLDITSTSYSDQTIRVIIDDKEESIGTN